MATSLFRISVVPVIWFISQWFTDENLQFYQFQLYLSHDDVCPDEFIKERERYAIIGDDLDIAFVGQRTFCQCAFNILVANTVYRIQILCVI